MFIAHHKFTHMRTHAYVSMFVDVFVTYIYIFFYNPMYIYNNTTYLFDIFQYLYTPIAQKLQQYCSVIAAILLQILYCMDT